MTISEYINIIASACMVEAPNDVTDAQDYEVARFYNALSIARREILTQNTFIWNSHLETIEPNVDDEVVLPNRRGIAKFYVDPSLKDSVVERQVGEPLWDRQNNVAYSQSLSVLICDMTDYEKIPDLFAYWIAWRAAELMSMQLNGVEVNMQFIRAEKTLARQKALNSEPKNLDTLSEFGQIVAAYSLRS